MVFRNLYNFVPLNGPKEWSVIILKNSYWEIINIIIVNKKHGPNLNWSMESKIIMECGIKKLIDDVHSRLLALLTEEPVLASAKS